MVRLFNNDRLSHWFAGALASWLIFFLIVCLPVFHFLLRVPTNLVAAFTGIFCAGQLAVTPWIFRARATPQNPIGRTALRALSIYIWFSVSMLFFLYYFRLVWSQDIETRRFTTITMLIMLLFGAANVIRYGIVLRRQE